MRAFRSSLLFILVLSSVLVPSAWAWAGLGDDLDACLSAVRQHRFERQSPIDARRTDSGSGARVAQLALLEYETYFDRSEPLLEEPVELARAARLFCGEAARAVDQGERAVADFRGELAALARDPSVAEYPQLTLEEKAAILDYTGTKFYFINAALRRGYAEVLASGLGPKIFALSSGLRKLPDYRGLAYRRAGALPMEVLAEHFVGSEVTYAAFTSSTRGSSPGDFPGGGPHRLLIYSAHGKPIAAYSGIPKENEILFDAGTRFRVLDRLPIGDEAILFVIREIPSP